MRGDPLIYSLTWINIICWIVCFWWMHRISSRQATVLKELKDQGVRIEELSRHEHDMLQEVHPQVSEIKEAVEEVVQSTREMEVHPPERQK